MWMLVHKSISIIMYDIFSPSLDAFTSLNVDMSIALEFFTTTPLRSAVILKAFALKMHAKNAKTIRALESMLDEVLQ